jgi:hypothetical protein
MVSEMSGQCACFFKELRDFFGKKKGGEIKERREKEWREHTCMHIYEVGRDVLQVMFYKMAKVYKKASVDNKAKEESLQNFDTYSCVGTEMHHLASSSHGTKQGNYIWSMRFVGGLWPKLGNSISFFKKKRKIVTC